MTLYLGMLFETGLFTESGAYWLVSPLVFCLWLLTTFPQLEVDDTCTMACE